METANRNKNDYSFNWQVGSGLYNLTDTLLKDKEKIKESFSKNIFT